MRSEWRKGVILADEGGLGKTMETLLVLSQLWFEGKERILLIVPTPLLSQWTAVLERDFAVPYAVVGRDNPNFAQEGIVLTTYEIAADFAEEISNISWNVAAFEEAHRLNKPENKLTVTLKSAVSNAFKILLTATPMQNSIMDLYGLLAFIDETVLPDAEGFYKRYFRKPEQYGELTAIVSRYAFRTLRSQARRFVNLPRRLPVTANYKQNAAETKLTAMIDDYLKKPEKTAFPKMDAYECNLMFWKALSSSTSALLNLLDGTLDRTDELKEMREFAAGIKSNAKGGELVKALKKAFAELKKRGANRKALIFTEYKATQKYLSELLSDDYNVTADYDKFADADILVTTDIAAEGFNFEFCSFVVNYDLPYTVLTLEQRIMRCHRQGQKNDVVVLNFLNKSNFADVRMLELINKRVLRFDGIIAAFAETRTQKQIKVDYKATLHTYEDANAVKVERAENALFTTFTQDIAEKVTVTPQYIKDRADEMNAKLWELTKWFFHDKRDYLINEETQTLRVGITPQKVFTGASLRRREYSLADKTLSPVSSIAKNIINEIFWRGIPDSGTVTVENLENQVQIGYYRVR
ncbi:hypothetical protein AGMMS49975_15130 [Clostridia bacterium]|nr:hypothetical protein AGMMS49975_15130 [Clostridia bacterium]